MGLLLSKTVILKKVKISTRKMKGALLLIGVLVCISMTEARQAIQNRQLKANLAQGVRSVSDETGCGDNCDDELYAAYDVCIQDWSEDELPELIACMSLEYGSDCHDCLCGFIYDNTGYACP